MAQATIVYPSQRRSSSCLHHGKERGHAVVRNRKRKSGRSGTFSMSAKRSSCTAEVNIVIHPPKHRRNSTGQRPCPTRTGQPSLRSVWKRKLNSRVSLLHHRVHDIRTERVSFVKSSCSSTSYKEDGAGGCAGRRTRLHFRVNVTYARTRYCQ